MLDDMSTSTTWPHTPPVIGPVVTPSWARLRYLLLTLALAVGVGMLLFGTRPASFSELSSRIAQGKVTQVTVVNALPVTSTGRASAELRWHDGLVPRFTPVLQEVPGPQSDEQVVFDTTTRPYPITGSIDERLNEFAPGPLALTHIEDRASTTWFHYGWKVPAWVTLVGVLVGLLTLALLVTGPQPVRATRWAWFWAIASPVSFVTIPLFLLFGVPRTGDVEQPYTRLGRLTGGWSFILFCVLVPSLLAGLLP